MRKFSLAFILIFSLSVILRILILFWSLNFRENSDVLRYKDWGRISYLYGFNDTYKTTHLLFGTLPNNQPPGSLYIISAAYNAQIQASKLYAKLTKTKPGSNPWINGPLMDIFLRIPSLIADMLLGVLIYLFVKSKSSESGGLLASSLFFFNPVVLYNSSFWGQMDSLNNVIFFISLIFLIQNKYFISILSFFLSLFIKTSLLPLIPLYIYIILLHKKNKKIYLLPMSIFAILIIILLTLPISLKPSWLINFYRYDSQGEMTQITNFAFNFWWLIFFPWIKIVSSINLFNFAEIRLVDSPYDSFKYLGLPLYLWGVILFLASLVPFFFLLVKYPTKVLKENSILLLFALSALIAFIFLPRMHERYSYPFFPIIAAYIGMKKKLFWAYIIFSILSFINLFIVWHPMPYFFLYKLINNRSFQWALSAITVIMLLYFYIKSFSLIMQNEK